jgi:hypothetical protein
MIITLVFEENGNFFTEMGQKSQKIVTVTSTPYFFASPVSGTFGGRLLRRRQRRRIPCGLLLVVAGLVEVVRVDVREAAMRPGPGLPRQRGRFRRSVGRRRPVVVVDEQGYCEPGNKKRGAVVIRIR